MKYELKDIIIFTHVAKLGSFVRASEVLDISKPVVSTRISELEKAIGINLLARTTREVNLTNDGKTFFKYCQEIIEKIDNTNYFLQKQKGVYGTLRIAMPTYFSIHRIVPYLREFYELYPQVKLDILLTENNINIIKECCDLQIRIQKPDEEDLETARLVSNKKVICTSRKYLETHDLPLYPKDLLNHNCIVFAENTVWTFRHKVSGEIVKLHDMTGNVKCNNGEIIKYLILADMGITVKSSTDIEDEISQGEIVVVLPEYEVINETEYYVVYPRGKFMSLKTKAFIEFFQEKLGYK